MTLPIIPAKNRTVIEYPLDAAQDFEKGAPVILDAQEEVNECGADPAAILGFAVHPSMNAGVARELLPGKQLVAVAMADTTFWGKGSSTFTQDDIGKAYGLVDDGTGVWIIDKTDAVNTCVRIVAIDTELDMAEFVVEEDTIVLS